MNAKEALQLCDVSGGPVEVVLYPAGEFAETILRALRLLAAAEANDGSTPETDASVDPFGLLRRRLERERNALAARVGELSADVERAAKDVQRVAEEMATKMAAPAHARAEKAEAERDALKRHAEAMANAIQFGDMAILTVAKAAADSYRSDYPKDPK